MSRAKAESLVELMQEEITLPEGFSQPILFAQDRRAKPHLVLARNNEDPIIFRPMVTKWPYAHQEIRQARHWASYMQPQADGCHPVAVRQGGDNELLGIIPISSLVGLLS